MEGVQEGGDLSIHVADYLDVWQRPTQDYRAIVLQ